MAKGKDFYGKDIAEVIDQACKVLGASREDLDIEVLETGSAGIFGLCKKKAHIRAQRKSVTLLEEVEATTPPTVPVEQEPQITAGGVEEAAAQGQQQATEEVTEQPAAVMVEVAKPEPPAEKKRVRKEAVEEEQELDAEEFEEEEQLPVEPPSAENLAAIQADLHHLLTLMGLPSEVQVAFEEHTVQCTITGPHEADIVGPEGRTLDSIQYLLRKMVARHLPDRIMLALNAGDFRERRTEQLKERAVALAEQVKADGKTQAIPALNPSERRVVHMVLQGDKGVRSRSVGEGLFKKVLIYKPGKGRRPTSKKRRGGQGGRSSGD